MRRIVQQIIWLSSNRGRRWSWCGVGWYRLRDGRVLVHGQVVVREGVIVRLAEAPTASRLASTQFTWPFFSLAARAGHKWHSWFVHCCQSLLQSDIKIGDIYAARRFLRHRCAHNGELPLMRKSCISFVWVSTIIFRKYSVPSPSRGTRRKPRGQNTLRNSIHWISRQSTRDPSHV